MNTIDQIEKEYIKRECNFEIGDTVNVHVKIIEGKRERIQIFQGIVIAIKRSSNRTTFKVRKISYNTGVERTFPLQSPIIDKIEIIKKGRVRRAKLYYLRKRKGKAAQVKERIIKKSTN